ncbi:MAG: cation diffusion facilitator family transporter [Chitinophagaceae bacterium]
MPITTDAAAQQNLRTQFWITLLSVVLLCGKMVAYYITHSVAVLSDALESIVNVVSGVIGLYSLYVAAKPKDADHPYGHGKAEFVSAAVEGGLIASAGLLTAYQAVLQWVNQQTLHSIDIGLTIVGITAVVNFGAGAWCLQLGKKNKSLALQASGKHLQADTYSTIAIVVGLLLVQFLQWYWLDKLVALAMSMYIMFNGYTIIRASLAGIMDEADTALLQSMVQTLNENRRLHWIDLHNLRVIKYGSHLHLDCHLTVPWYLNVHEAHQEVDALEALIKQHYGNSLELFVHTDGCLPFSCTICSKADCIKRERPQQQQLEWTLSNILSNQKHQAINV